MHCILIFTLYFSTFNNPLVCVPVLLATGAQGMCVPDVDISAMFQGSATVVGVECTCWGVGPYPVTLAVISWGGAHDALCPWSCLLLLLCFLSCWQWTCHLDFLHVSALWQLSACLKFSSAIACCYDVTRLT